MILRRTVLWTGLSAFAVLGSLPASAQETGPAVPVERLIQGLEAVRVTPRGTPFAQVAAALTPVVQRAFNLEDVVRTVVGPRYAGLPDEQKTTLLQVFTDYTVASYVSNFMGSPDRFEIEPGSRAVGSDQVVTTRIVPANGAPTRLDYQVRNGPAGWQIVDVLIDGSISQVAVQRSDFRSLLRDNSAQPLIDSLRKKTASLAAGGKG